MNDQEDHQTNPSIKLMLQKCLKHESCREFFKLTDNFLNKNFNLFLSYTNLYQRDFNGWREVNARRKGNPSCPKNGGDDCVDATKNQNHVFIILLTQPGPMKLLKKIFK